MASSAGFKSISITNEEHAKVKEMAKYEERNLARQLGIIVRKEYERFKEHVKDN